MAEDSEVRLVRCPKCENLLPEPPGFSVYQCGGCGAVLRAKKKGILEDGLLETSDDERGRIVSEKGDVNNVGLSSVSGAEMESNGIEAGGIFKRNNHENAVLNGGSSSSGVENRGVLEDFDRSRRGRERLDLGFDQNGKTRFTEGEYKNSSKGPNDELIQDNRNCDFNTSRLECVKGYNENHLEELKHLVGSLRSRLMVDQTGVDRNSLRPPRVNASSVAGQGRFVDFQHPDVGPSNYVRGPYYNFGEGMRYGDGSDGLARVETLENDRVELLRKLDELADQLTRSCDVADKPRERIHHDRRIPPVPPDTYDRHDAFMQDGRYFYGVNKQSLAPDKHVSSAPYVNHSHGYVPYMDGNGIPFQESYPPRNLAYGYGGLADVYHPQILRRPSHQPPNRYIQESRYEHFPGHHIDFNQDLFMSHAHETFFHQPACCCLHCVNKNWQASSKVQPPNLCSQNAQSTYTNCNLHQPVNPVTYHPQGYISESSNHPPPQCHDRKPITRSSSDLDREKFGFGHSWLKKVALSNGGRRFFHPIAGGAPLVTCCNCFELLKLPRKLLLMQKSQRKIKCGACSSVLLFELDGKTIVVSVPATSEQVFSKVHASSTEMLHEKFQSSYDFPDTDAVGNSDTYENFNYNYQLVDAEPVLSSGDQKSNFGKSEMRQDPNSSTSSSSEDEQNPDSVIVRKETCSAEFPSKDEVCLPLPDSPTHNDPGHSPDNLMHKYGQGNKSKRIEDRNPLDGKTSRQNSLKDTPVATEMDVSYDDHFGLTHDSAEISKEEELPRINKGVESFFVGLIKRRFGEFSRSSKNTESGRSNVSVNGHFIPDRVVKKAKKLSGPINPGEYWYDIRAGFWGVMGHPCLGIILPNIEEFNYPMPENCAGGDTEVFVNGRELHQKDLDLLASRGLPITRHKSYLIDISGRVVDENTGEELDGLGKLAPTVERAKHGFGMKTPKSLLQQRR